MSTGMRMSASALMIALLLSISFAGTASSYIPGMPASENITGEENHTLFLEKAAIGENETLPAGAFGTLATESGYNDVCPNSGAFSWQGDYAYGTVSPTFDEDWWKFYADKSGTYGIFLYIDTSSLDVDLHVLSSCASGDACSSGNEAGKNDFCDAYFQQGWVYVRVEGRDTTGSYHLVATPRCDSDQCCWEKYGYCYAHCGKPGEPPCSTAGSQISKCVSRADTSQGNFICAGSCQYSGCTDNDPDRAGSLDCCSCSCSTGACCNGCSYRPSGYVCDSSYGTEYGCYYGTGDGSDVWYRTSGKHCTGASATCDGSVLWDSWRFYQDCPGGYYASEYRCSGSSLERRYMSSGCSSGSCQTSAQWNFQQDCGSGYCDSWGSAECYNGDVYRFRECHDKGCSSGACHDTAFTNSELMQDCPESGYTDEYTCSGTTSLRRYVNNWCNGGACQSSDQWNPVEECGSDIYGEWSGLVCIGGDVGKYRVITYKGCSDGVCFEDDVTQTITIEECNNGCENSECIRYPDFGVTQYDIIFEAIA